MAGYFLTNKLEIALKAKSVFHKDFNYKEITSKTTDDTWRLIVLEKAELASAQNTFYDGEDFIVGVGTYFSHKGFGADLLEDVLNNFQKSGFFDSLYGHFNFIIYKNRKLHLVTDKSGHYHSFVYEKAGVSSYSTSFTAMLAAHNNLKPSKQEIIEFINVAATFGGKTISKEINHCEAGTIIDLAIGSKKKYFKFFVKESNLEKLSNVLKEYFEALAFSRKKIGIDLSGGFDTRTALSAAHSAGLNATMLSNVRPKSVSRDIDVANIVSKTLSLIIKEIPLESNEKHFYPNNTELVKFLEGARGIDILKRVYNEIINKTSQTNVIIGGWGAEMLRNQHGKFSSVKTLASGYGYNRIILNNFENSYYCNNLTSKFYNTLYQINKPKYVNNAEILFYMEKGKYWVGSVLTARNKFGYWLFPFFDATIASQLLGLKNKGNKLQKNVINYFEPELKIVPFGNMDTESTLTTYVKGFIKKMTGRKINKGNDEYDYPFEKTELKTDPEKFCGISLQYLLSTKNKRSVAKYFTISELIYLMENEFD